MKADLNIFFQFSAAMIFFQLILLVTSNFPLFVQVLILGIILFLFILKLNSEGSNARKKGKQTKR